MILPGFPVLLSKPASQVWPMATITVAAIPPAFFGFILSGGITEGIIVTSSGSISRSLVSGYVTDAVIDNGEGEVQIVIQGDCVAVLSNVTEVLIDGVPYPLSFSPTYYSDEGYTYVVFSGSPWSGSGTHTIQLV